MSREVSGKFQREGDSPGFREGAGTDSKFFCFFLDGESGMLSCQAYIGFHSVGCLWTSLFKKSGRKILEYLRPSN